MLYSLAQRKVELTNTLKSGAYPGSPYVEGEEMVPYTEAWNGCDA